MSKFLIDKYSALKPYTPGEQPRERKYIKLNTNESPFPPSRCAQRLAAREARRLYLYPDPNVTALTSLMAEELGVSADEVIMTNGSDEVLNFAFMAFCDENREALFPDITYGFYRVFAALSGVPYTEIPLGDDLTVSPDDYIGRRGTVFIANPNAPTGIALPLSEIERIVASDPGRVVVVDEAYVDFGTESAVSLIKKYDNLLVTGTFSKSRSMAGARLGYGVGSAELIPDLVRIKYSTNPYNVNRMTAAAGLGALLDRKYFKCNCKKIIENREWTASELSALGFEMTPTRANFLFVKSDKISGKELYLALRREGILVRHFDSPRISDYVRITVGSKKQMQILVDKIKNLSEMTK
ncbi:MAG: histidinol-phosphate transaminase [Clostridia bacterium]|nr:histidinol-phosphate transaminase [Clostridia bacterium]